MKKNKPPDIQLVITFALKKEVPKDFFSANNVPVHTLEAVKAGALESRGAADAGILVLITGAGLKAGKEAASWILNNLAPLFVLNIGTCGIIDKKISPGTWLKPGRVSNEAGDTLGLDDRLPVPFPDKMTQIRSLLSVRKPATGDTPAHLKLHDAIDMECFAQAEIFSTAGTTFHCLKFGTDYSDHNTAADFQNHLGLFREELKNLLEPAVIPPFTKGDTGGSDITAVIPVYNREHTIRRALDSILSQTLPPEEIIVVDDASTDRTGKILENYENRITLIPLNENSGPSKARNKGTGHAKTEWVAFLDSDDCWEKDKLEKEADYLRTYPFYKILQSEEKWIRNGKRVNPRKHHKKLLGWIWEPSLERCLVSPSGVLIKKSLLEQCGKFNEYLPVCEDYDLWLKVSRYHPVGLVPEPSVIKYGGHQDQLSGKYHAMDRFRVDSLYRLLRSEPMPRYRQKIIIILEKKLNILIRGYEKRGMKKDVTEYRDILASLAEFR